MNEASLQRYLIQHFPKENAACEWKEFKSLRHALVGSAGKDVVSYLSAIANMEGGRLVREFGSASRSDLRKLTLDKLSDALDDKQKENKFRNLMYAMSKRDQTIEIQRVNQKQRWVLARKRLDEI